MKKIYLFIIFILIVVLGYNFLAHPYEVAGNPASPFVKGQTVFADKIVFLFRDPKQNDRIIFSKNGMDYIGSISFVNESEPLPYQVKSAEGKADWQISRENIHSHIWFPRDSRSFKD